MAAFFREVGRIALVWWIEPTVDDLRDIRARLQELGARLGRLPIYIAITPAECPPPTDAVRKEMLDTLAEASALTDSLHLVLEGSGLRFSALRGIVASIFLIAGNRKTFAHDRLDGAIKKALLSDDEAAAVRAAAAAMAEEGALTRG